MLNLGIVRPGSTIYVPFDSFAGSTGASITLTGLAATDIEIYKDGSTTQRGSDNGYTLLDTDGIDVDGITGHHGFSISLADNSTAGFYASGSRYWVVVSSVTIDSQTVNFIAAYFEIGYPDAVLNTTIATLASQTSFTLTSGPAEDDALNGSIVVIHDVASAVQLGYAVILDYTGSTKTVTLSAGTTFTAAATDNIAIFPPSNVTHAAAVAWNSGSISASTLASDTIAAAKIAAGAITSAKFAAGAIDATAIADNAIDAGAIANDAITAAKIATGAIDADAIADNAIDAGAIATGAITSAKFAAGAITATVIATDAIDADALAADAVTEIQSGLATAAALDAVDNFLDTEVAAILAAVDTEVAAIKAVTDLLPDAGALTSLATQASVNTIDDFLDTEIAAIKAKTDNLPASPAAVGSAMTLTSGERTSVADALLDRDMATGTDSGSDSVRTVRQALRPSRNKIDIAAGTLTVYKEDDSTPSHTAAVTTTAGNPISTIDPA